MHTDMNEYIYTYLYIYIYIYMNAHVHTRVCIYICTHTYTYVQSFFSLFFFNALVIYIFICIYTHTHTHSDIYIYIYIVHSIWFQTFKIVIDSGKFSMLLLYILWDDWPIFMISCSNEQLQQELEYILLKPDCHSWWISRMQSGREDTLKFCFKLGKNATETYGMLQTAFGSSSPAIPHVWFI